MLYSHWQEPIQELSKNLEVYFFGEKFLLIFVCPKKVIVLFEESIKTVQEYDKNVLRLFPER